MSQAFEIRPHPATGLRGANLKHGGINQTIRQWRLAVDPDAGTVSWQTQADKPFLMRLPGRGPEHLPELARLAVVDTDDSVNALVGGVRSLVLVGADGRALTEATVRPRPVFRAIFDDDAFQPLAPHGVEVVHEIYPTVRRLDQRYPGAESLSRKIIVTYRWVTITLFVLVTVVVIGLLIN